MPSSPFMPPFLQNSDFEIFASPCAIHPNSDKFILVKNPYFPSIVTCKFLRPKRPPINLHWLEKEAKKVGHIIIPSFDINLDKYLMDGVEITEQLPSGAIIIKILPFGTISVIPDASGQYLSIEGKRKATMKIFESLFGQGNWTIGISKSLEGYCLALSSDVDENGEKVSFSGKINTKNNGIEVILHPASANGTFHYRSFAISGNFGFKVEITGQWRKWQASGYPLTNKTFSFSSSPSRVNEMITEYKSVTRNAFIIGSSFMMGGGLIGIRYLPRLLKWSTTLPWYEEVIFDAGAGATAIIFK